MLTRTAFIALAAIILALSGCSKSEERPAVNGQQEQDDTPVAELEQVDTPDNAGTPAAETQTEPEEEDLMKEKYGVSLKKGMYAIFETSMGDIIVELYPDKAPMTVENFAALAEGKKEYVDPRDRQKKTESYYDGTIFHRVIQGFMIQGGDPTGTGRGGPGYQFQDEFSDLRFDQPGYLAMANAGPNTNGGQFFITVAPTPHLNNRHTIFGKVVAGMDIVMEISRVQTTKPADKPVQDVVIRHISIERIK